MFTLKTIHCQFMATAISVSALVMVPPVEAETFILSNQVFECDENGKYVELNDLISKIEKGTAKTPRLSCFKNWMSDATDDRNIIVIFPETDEKPMSETFDQIVYDEAIQYLTKKFRESDKYTNQYATVESQSAHITFEPIKISRSAEILPRGGEETSAFDITANEFSAFIKSQNKSLIKLVQYNLKQTFSFDNNDFCGNNKGQDRVFYRSNVDGGWGKRSEDALATFIETCHPTEDKITAKMVTEFLLPQVFTYLDAEQSQGGTQELNEDGNETTAQNGEGKKSSSSTNTSIENKTDQQEKEPSGLGAGSTFENLEKHVQLQTELDRAQKQINEQKEQLESLVSSHKEALADVERKAIENVKKEQFGKTLFELWADLEIKVVGQMPDGKLVEGIEANLQKYCNVSPLVSIREAAISAYKKSSCFDYETDQSDVDDKKPPFWNETTGAIIIPLQSEREKFIKSMVSDVIAGLAQQNIGDCLINLSFLKDGMEISNYSVGGSVGLSADWRSTENPGAYLKAFGLETAPIAYDGLSIKLEAPEHDWQKCALKSETIMPILSEKEQNNGSAQAVVDRDGNIFLHDLAISVVKGATLAVFFDTNVGFVNSHEYAFNASLSNTRSLALHRSYFAGFAQALSIYLQTQNDFENIIIYQALSDKEAAEMSSLQDFKVMHRASDIQDPAVKKQIIDALGKFSNDFEGGQIGAYSKKESEIKRLLQDVSPVHFLMFGPSGLDQSQVCDVNTRADTEQNLTIFDVWPGPILEYMLESEKVTAGEQYFYQCNDSRNLFGLKVGLGADEDDIGQTMSAYLKQALE